MARDEGYGVMVSEEGVRKMSFGTRKKDTPKRRSEACINKDMK